MGKWTPSYVDDVLHGKVSNLVSGSIRRAAVEKEPSITYENFVSDLDTGDSFTASLVDILVKELADRRTRNNAHDRTLIAERTIKSLRQLASTGRSYFNRAPIRTHQRRADFPPEEFGSTMPDPEFEDEEFEMIMEDPGLMEGTRISAGLYEAFATTAWPPSAARRITASPPASDEWPLPPPLRSPPDTARPWSAASAPPMSGPSNLTRQASIRRAARSRFVDFHDRRRPYSREVLAPTRSEAPETVTEPRETAGYPTHTVRRFFPRSRRNQTTVIPWSELSDAPSLDSDDQTSAQFFAIDPSHTTWYHAPTPDPLRASPDADNRDREETENLLRAPRLRPHRAFAGATASVSRRSSSTDVATGVSVPAAAVSAPSLRQHNDNIASTEEPVGYPTPGSTENENVA